MKKINVTISPLGVAKIEAEGFVGTACQLATKPLTDALGGAATETAKPELYDVATEETQVSQGW